MDLLSACAIAKTLLRDLEAGCERIAIAGSIRRKMAKVKDIEIVAIPIVNYYEELNLFGEVAGNKRIDVLSELLDAKLKDPAWEWQKDTEIKRWGPKYKKLRHKEWDISCDLFYAKIGSWGGMFTIRTGPADFSHAIARLTQRKGYHLANGCFLHRHPKPSNGCRAGEHCKMIVACPTEEIFFKQLGIPFIEPEKRTEEQLRKIVNKSRNY